jgi:hypothetical protein
VKLLCTTNAVSDVVVPAVGEEKSALIGTQNTRPTTIKMLEKLKTMVSSGEIAREHCGHVVVCVPTLRHPESKGDGSADATGTGRQLASTGVLSWSAREE